MQLKNNQSSRRSMLEGRAGWHRYLSTLLWSLIGIAALMPALLWLIGILGEHWYPVLDQATMELRVRDVLTHHTSLTGAFGRFDWNHPGPAMYWLVSPFSLSAGGAANASRIGFLFWGIAALALALFLAWRVSRSFYLAISLVIVFSYFSTDPEVFTNPWNPWIPVPLLVLLIVLTYRVAIGRVRDLIGVFVVGSLMIQSHAGSAIVVILSIAFCAFFVGADWVRSKKTPDGLVGAAGWSFGGACHYMEPPGDRGRYSGPWESINPLQFFPTFCGEACRASRSVESHSRRIRVATAMVGRSDEIQTKFVWGDIRAGGTDQMVIDPFGCNSRRRGRGCSKQEKTRFSLSRVGWVSLNCNRGFYFSF